MKIYLNRIGKILCGQGLGGYVKVVAACDGAGGFLVLLAPHPDMRDGINGWLRSFESLRTFFDEVCWAVE